jgi:two-component system response regulator NreC
MTDNTTNVLLVDDHQMLKDGLRLLINGEPDMTVTAEASTGKEALKMIRNTPLDVVILDLGLEGMSGLEVIKILREMGNDIKIIVLSMHGDQDMITQVFKVGGDGFVPKSTAHDHLLMAIRTVLSGDTYMHPSSAADTIQYMRTHYRTSLKLGELSDRELEVVTLTVLGYTRSEISKQLNIKPKTVDTYRARAMEKLQLDSRAELVQFAIKAGLLNDAKTK